MSSERSIAYHVELTARASLDLETIYESIDAEHSVAAAAWYNSLEELVLSLEHLPQRGATTAENRRLRQLLHRAKPHVYRIFYSIDPASKRVLILHIRHGARGPLRPQELG
jgi:toxin ParE1/3/4